MKLKWGCLLTPRTFERETATTPLGSSNKTKPKRPDAVAAQTRLTSKPFNEFAAGLTIGEDAILRIHQEERDDDPNDVYFVGQVVERAQKLCAPG